MVIHVLMTGALVYYIEDITRKDHKIFHKKALQNYVNTPQVIFCLSYDFSKELFIFFKVDIYFNEKHTVVMDVVKTLLFLTKVLIPPSSKKI